MCVSDVPFFAELLDDRAPAVDSSRSAGGGAGARKYSVLNSSQSTVPEPSTSTSSKRFDISARKRDSLVTYHAWTKTDEFEEHHTENKMLIVSALVHSQRWRGMLSNGTTGGETKRVP